MPNKKGEIREQTDRFLEKSRIMPTANLAATELGRKRKTGTRSGPNIRTRRTNRLRKTTPASMIRPSGSSNVRNITELLSRRGRRPREKEPTSRKLPHGKELHDSPFLSMRKKTKKGLKCEGGEGANRNLRGRGKILGEAPRFSREGT